MRHGFSLVELSIVLVILGLLTGGILSGQSLIRAAELRSVVTEYQNYATAVQSFRDSYMAIPGDMRNATSFWGAMTNCAVASPSGTGTQTCNGNGNGQILEASAASRTGEIFAFWKHLSNAGLIEGDYSGIAGSGGGFHVVIGVNAPTSRMSNAGWSAGWVGEIDSSSLSFFPGSYGNTLQFGAESSTGSTASEIISPEEAWNVDTKLDDGKPESGRARPYKAHAGTGVTNCSNTTTREYMLQNTGKLCSLRFLEAF